jgi:hypothetical protein
MLTSRRAHRAADLADAYDQDPDAYNEREQEL